MKPIVDRMLGATIEDFSDESAERLRAIARLLTYARAEANELDADVLAYCLDVALAAANDRLKEQAAGHSFGGHAGDGVEFARRH